MSLNLHSQKLSAVKSRRGFTLVEIMVVIGVIGVLSLLAYPALKISRNNAKAARFINDARTAGTMFETEAMQTGVYPDTTGLGGIPASMTNELGRIGWARPTALGGMWQWSVDSAEFYAGVLVVGSDQPREIFLRIDARIDDGNLGTGRFQEVGAGYAYILE